MTIKAIIFDLGGVLLRTADFSSRDHLATKLGLSRNKLEFLVFGGESGDQAQRGEITVREHWEILRTKMNRNARDFQAILDEFFAQDEMDQDLLDFIRSLHPQYKVGLLSNAWDDLRQTLRQRWDINGLFDQLIISAEVKMVKPDPRIYHLAVERLGVLPAEAIFIDDIAENVEAARREGLLAIQFQNTQTTLDALKYYLSAK